MEVEEQVSSEEGAHMCSIHDAVNMVSRKYATLGHMILAHKRTEDLDSRLLLELAILVHMYLKVGKPTEMKDRIAAIWDVLCTN
tara:strand:+ start:100 stop:351 length:252 start_codon:yes stop_codon:yes gene_type:complete